MGSFDHINQEALLKKLQTYTAMRHVIHAWLRAGVLEGKEFSPTEAGTPQGGVVSPLLANIALHGVEEAAAQAYRKKKEKPVLIRYADDFLIFHPEKEVLDKATQAVTTWLENLGLILSPKKTRVTHTLNPYEGSIGFDFLGFTVRQFPVGKTHTGKDPKGRPLGFKTIISPSKEAIKQHVAETKKRMRKLRGAPQERLIRELNPVIRGWANYYRTAVSARVYSECDSVLYHQLVSWAKWRHRYKGIKWILGKYWRQIEHRKWVFSTPDEMAIRRHTQTSIISPYVKVKGNASPYDGDLLYWIQRLKHHPMMREKLARLLQQQQGKCRWCELTFRNEDLIEIDHRDGNHANERLSNQMALHRHCHDEKHTQTPKEWKYAVGINHK